MSDYINLEKIRDEDGVFKPEFIEDVISALRADDKNSLQARVDSLHEADLADLIEILPKSERQILVERVGAEMNYAALSELEEPVRDEVLDILPAKQLADAVSELESDDAAYLLEDLDQGERNEILAKIPKTERESLKRVLEYPEDSAGRLMQTSFVAVPETWSVGRTIDYMRKTDELPSEFFEIFVVNARFKLVGTLPLSRVLRTQRSQKVTSVMDNELTLIDADQDQEETAFLFQNYNLVSAPVVDDDERLVGVITIDDIVDVIQEEASEDIRRLGGVGDESLTDTVFKTTKARFIWLFVNLITAVLASVVIGMFDATIEQMVALAILMPIVASMGGNAGTQTMTVAVRAIATNDLMPMNAWRVVSRELLVGFVNGILFAIIIGVVAYLWFGLETLGYVIAGAMVVNMIVAALSGILVPMTFEKMDIDPAIASSVFVTTVTDVVGFFAFLGLAALWLV